jgi:hypothetical protein
LLWSQRVGVWERLVSGYSSPWRDRNGPVDYERLREAYARVRAARSMSAAALGDDFGGPVGEVIREAEAATKLLHTRRLGVEHLALGVLAVEGGRSRALHGSALSQLSMWRSADPAYHGTSSPGVTEPAVDALFFCPAWFRIPEPVEDLAALRGALLTKRSGSTGYAMVHSYLVQSVVEAAGGH